MQNESSSFITSFDENLVKTVDKTFKAIFCIFSTFGHKNCTTES